MSIVLIHFFFNTQKLLMRQPVKQLLKGRQEMKEGQMVGLKLL